MAWVTSIMICWSQVNSMVPWEILSWFFNLVWCSSVLFLWPFFWGGLNIFKEEGGVTGRERISFPWHIVCFSFWEFKLLQHKCSSQNCLQRYFLIFFCFLFKNCFNWAIHFSLPAPSLPLLFNPLPWFPHSKFLIYTVDLVLSTSPVDYSMYVFLRILFVV